MEQPGTPTATRGERRCCRKVEVRLVSIKVVKKTDGPGDDDVFFASATEGERVTLARPPFYPDEDGQPSDIEIEEGDVQPVGKLLATVEAGQDCRVKFRTVVRFFEIDAGDIKKAVEKLFDDVKAAVPGGALVPDSTVDALKRLFRRFLELFGFGDLFMGQVEFGGDFVCLCGEDQPFDKVGGFSPALDDASSPLTYTASGKDTLVVKQTLRAHGGVWDITVAIQRFC